MWLQLHRVFCLMAVINTEDECTTAQEVAWTFTALISPQKRAPITEDVCALCIGVVQLLRERMEISAGLEARRRCIYAPAESRAILQHSISQSEGGTPPSVSLQAKSCLAEWDRPQWSWQHERFMWWRVACASAPVCAVSVVSWRRLCNRFHWKQPHVHKRHVLCLYSSKDVGIPCSLLLIIEKAFSFIWYLYFFILLCMCFIVLAVDRV